MGVLFKSSIYIVHFGDAGATSDSLSSSSGALALEWFKGVKGAEVVLVLEAFEMEGLCFLEDELERFAVRSFHTKQELPAN